MKHLLHVIMVFAFVAAVQQQKPNRLKLYSINWNTILVRLKNRQEFKLPHLNLQIKVRFPWFLTM